MYRTLAYFLSFCVILPLAGQVAGKQHLSDTLSQSLREIQINHGSPDGFHDVFTGTDKLQSDDIRRLPTFLGEVDVLRSLRFLPGVQSVSEGNSGVYVRGGSAGHNLFVLDGMELYNPSHLMGLYSVFNPMTTSGVDVYKGCAPVQLQGRLASTVLVQSFDPCETGNRFECNLGIINSSLAFTRISSDSSWTLVAGYRKSYLGALGWLVSPFIPKFSNYFLNNLYRFSDFNGKITWRSSEASLWSLAWYSGSDRFDFRNDALHYDAASKWGNQAAMLSFDHRLNQNGTFHSDVSVTKTYSGLYGEMLESEIDFKSDLTHYQWKNRWGYRLNRHWIQTGLDLGWMNGNPLDMYFKYMTALQERNAHFQNMQASIYVGDEWSNAPGNWKFYAGTRVTATLCPGPYIFDSLRYGRLELVKTWWNVAPVFSASWILNPQHVLKAAITMNNQQVHLASLSSIPLPYDLWMPVSPVLRPETGDQLTFGYYRSTNDGIAASAEVYVKDMRHQVLFNVITDNTESRGFEDQFIRGKGYAYGLDLSLSKSWTNGGVNLRYSYARSFRSFPEITQGSWFRDKYDRPHDFNIQGHWNPGGAWSFSAVWTFASGCNLNLPTGRWWMAGSIVNDYDRYNAFRLPPYHRLDVSADLHLKSKRFKESVVNFSVVNLYNRPNPYYASFWMNMGEGRYDLSLNSSQISLFPILPSISWRFKW